MQHYAAVRLTRQQAQELADIIARAERQKCEQIDIVLFPDGTITIEDAGVIGSTKGQPIEFQCTDGSQNVLGWITARKEHKS